MAEEWKYYLLRNIDRSLLRKLKRDAKREKVSLQQFIRSLLCEQYALDCPFPGGDSKLEFGSRNQHLWLQPELHRAIKYEAETSGRSMRSLILDVLEDHYQEVTPV